MPINPSIFKAYDLRGIYPDQFNEEIAYLFSRAYVVFLQSFNPGKALSVVVSRDMRLSSDSLYAQIINGLTDQGADVIDIGLASTPSLYFNVAYFNYDGGLQITASHNPKEYNGLKVVRARALPVSGETGLFTIRDLIIQNNLPPASSTKGKVSSKPNDLDLLAEIQQKEWPINFSNIKPLKIVVDASNALGIFDMEALLKPLNATVIKLNYTLDGTFPSHSSDPLNDANLDQLRQAVVANNADIGLFPDGDCDRLFFVDNEGVTVRSDILRGIMSQLVLKDYPHSSICYDIRPGKITSDMISQSGGRPVVTRVGHSLIKEKMLEVDAPYGGESSGHHFFKFSFGTFEAPFIYAWKFLEYVSSQNKPISQITKPFHVYFQSGEINSEVADKDAVMAKLQKLYPDGSVSTLDGITIEYPDFWFNVRPSNTEPLLRLNLEAKTQNLMEQKRDEILAHIRS
ncbi:MAG: phosphomannomutase/phosphoglucomutase [Candidatus Shapirobacteria bacterium]|jgi:phosphomannomutase